MLQAFTCSLRAVVAISFVEAPAPELITVVNVKCALGALIAPVWGASG